MKHDWKKTEKQFYLPKTEPEMIKIPPFSFFSIAGQGDPNDKSFADYIAVLYSLSYSVKMSSKNGFAPNDYFDYTVYPLEGMWDISEEAKEINSEKLDKSSLVFNLMIRQPDFVTVAERIPKKFFTQITGYNGIFEIRIEFESNIFRIFCCFDEGNLIILLNGFQKKTQRHQERKLRKQYGLKQIILNIK